MNSSFPKRIKDINVRSISLKNYRIYKPTLIHTGSQRICVLCKDKGGEYDIEPDSLILLTRANSSYDIRITRINDMKDIKIQYIDDNFVGFFSGIRKNRHERPRTIFTTKLDDISSDNIYNLLSQEKISHFQYAAGLSYFGRDDEIMNSLAASSLHTLTDRIIEIIEADLQSNLTIEDVSKMLFVSPSGLRKKLQRDKITFRKLCLDVKMKHASIQLRTTDRNIYTIAYSLGFGSVSYFIKVFKGYYGVTPKKYVGYFRYD